MVHKLLGPLRGPLRLHGAPPLPHAASSSCCCCPALLLHEEVNVALLRLLLLLFPALVFHHQLADGFVCSDGVQFVTCTFPPFLSPPQPSCSRHAAYDTRVPPLASGPKVMGQAACAAEDEMKRRMSHEWYNIKTNSVSNSIIDY